MQEDRLTDYVRVLDCVVSAETIERDRRLLTGTVKVSVLYGVSAVDIAIPFTNKSSHAEAVRGALLHIENMGHFMETHGRLARLEYGCNS